MKEDEHLWKAFPELVKRIWEDHRKNNIADGHDFYHALLVAQYGPMIAEEGHIGVLAWIAGICHNTDRVFPEDQVEEKVGQYLALVADLSEKDKSLIIEAVLHHSGLNKPDDNPVTVVLKDADRLSGAGIICPVRAGQYLHGIPAFNPVSIESPAPCETFQNIMTVLSGMRFNLEWWEMLRCPKAKELGEKYFGVLQKAIEDLRSQLEEADISHFSL